MSNEVQTIRAVFPQVKGIWLFGSRATGQTNCDSDLDLAVWAGASLDPVALWNCGQRIAVDLGCAVDLVDLACSSTIFVFQVVKDGKRLFASDNYECDFFETTAISMYQRFRRERAEIVDAYVAHKRNEL
ncbi:MAG: nucleotidyltransferase domain-containing protein [Pseudomonadota bacterium]|nr:nucleotidyltransferase domain-containing protein [Pseudomonadota bacterium]